MTPFERFLAFMLKPWVIVGYIGLIVLSFLYFDMPLAYYFHAFDLRMNLTILNWVTKIGTGGIYLTLFLLLALFFRYVQRDKQWEIRFWFLWLSVLFPSLICIVLKILFGRARPDLLFDNQLYGFYWLKIHAPYWSFPSGHTTNIMGVVFGLSAILPRYCYAFIVAGLVVASTRILLTHHYLSDVLMASYLALLEVGLLYWWFRQKTRLAPIGVS